MKTTKFYKLLLLLPFLLSLQSFASDSLKVKKTEYYEDGKLVRATFFNKNNMKMREYFYDYCVEFDGNLQNEVLIFNFKNGKHYSITNYFMKIDGNNVIFSHIPFLGSIQSVEMDSLGHPYEANGITLIINVAQSERICSLDSLEFIPVKHEIGFKQKYYFDNSRNIIEKKYIVRVNFGKKIFFQYDSLNRQIGYILINKPKKTIGKIIYKKEYTETITETFLKKNRFKQTIERVYENELKGIIKEERFQIPLKKSKPIGEPKLIFIKENNYVNDRLVKIIYEDLLLGKKKVHELKYEFY